MGMPQKEMERYPEYIQAKREGKSEDTVIEFSNGVKIGGANRKEAP